MLAGETKAAIVVPDMPLLDTRQGRDLTGTLIADLVLQLLSYAAQTEGEFIRQRQAKGIAAAKAGGVHMGRMPMEIPDMTSGNAARFPAEALPECSGWPSTRLPGGPVLKF